MSAGNVQRTAASARKPLVLFLVVGETARAANFQLGGYARATNPRAAAAGRTSCTSTMRRRAARRRRSPCRACSRTCRASTSTSTRPTATRICSTRSTKADFAVEWRDNNAGCKGVCARVVQVVLSGQVGSRALPELVLLRRSHADRPRRAPGNAAAGHRRHLPRDRQSRSCVLGALSAAVRDLQAGLPLQRAAALQPSRRVVNAYDNSIVYTDSRAGAADRAAAGERGAASTACCCTRRITANRSASRASICTACRTRSRRACRRKCRCCSGPREATSSAPA